MTNLLYLARQANEVPEIHKHLGIAERELQRASVITAQTLRFYKQSNNPTATTAEELIDGVLAIHHGRLLNSQVGIKKCLRATKTIYCFEGETRQVFSNLIGNATDATPPSGGRLLIRSREATNWRTGQSGLIITVADSGSGMSAEVQKKIFEAFYTTKGLLGTGLGLWVCQEIIARHRGVLRVRSSEQQGRRGMVFTLFLPSKAAQRGDDPPVL